MPENPKDSESLWTSGFWAVSEATAKQLIGGMIYFHEKQESRSKRGGEIVGFEVVKSGEYAGRIIFRFRNDPNAKGVLTSRAGWPMEKKMVWSEE